MTDQTQAAGRSPNTDTDHTPAFTTEAEERASDIRRTLRKKDRQLAGALESFSKLKAETFALQKRRNELVVQNAKLKRELEIAKAGRRNEYHARIKTEKMLATESSRASKYKNAYTRLKSNPVVKLSRAVTAPARSLIALGKSKATSSMFPIHPSSAPLPSVQTLVTSTTQDLMRAVATAYRIDGNASSARAIADKLPVDYVPNASDQVLLDQIDGVIRLIKKAPHVPVSQSGIGYVPQLGRIMYCAHSTGEFNSNGYSTRTVGLTQALTASGADLLVAARPGYPWDIKTNAKVQKKTRFETVPNGVRTVYNPGTSWSRQALDQYIHEAADIYAREAMINRPSTIVAASNHVTALPALIAARRLGVPFAYEVRGLWEITEASSKGGYDNSERYSLAVKLETLVAENADHVFAITSQVRDELVRRGVDGEKITLLPNAADIYEFAPLRPEPALAAKYKLEDGLTLGYAGSILEYEGLDIAIHAVAELVSRGEAMKLVIAGDGPALADLKTLTAELGIMSSVQFVGRVPSSDVPRFIELFDVVLCPRISSDVTEMVSPLKPLEAMSAGKPVVASNVAPLVDLLGTDGSRGVLFKAGDVSDLARVLQELAHNKPKRNEIGREARQWIAKHRSWSAVAYQLLEGLSRIPNSDEDTGSRQLGDMTIALISDEFTRTSIQGDVNLVLPTPSDWNEVLAGSKVDLLFVESAWEGNGGSWTRKVGYYDDEECSELRALISHCRAEGIPTVFWNKEDPVHFNRFRKTAKYFDHVFTTDANCLKDYWGHRGSHLRTLASLPFWAQPGIHNPLPSGDPKQHTVAYGGSYYGDRFEKRSKELVELLDAAIPQGLTIYDRQFNSPDSPYVFPEHLREYVQGGLPYSEMLKAYKNHPVHINVNSVSNSPTMFSRRVFELAACGTPVLSGPGLEIGGLFGNAIPSSLTRVAMEKLVSRWMTDEPARLSAAWEALRVVYRSHLSAHRLAYVMRIAGLSVAVPALPGYTLEIANLTDEAAADIVAQSHRPMKVVPTGAAAPTAKAILAEAGIPVSEAIEAERTGIVGSLDKSLRDPFLAEDLVTAMQFTNSSAGLVDEGSAGPESQALWQLRTVDGSSETMTNYVDGNSGAVSIRRVPITVEAAGPSYEGLFAAAGESLTVLVAGHDLKFAGEIISELQTAGHNVIIDKWAGHSQHDAEQSLLMLEDADVIFCEWSLGNLAWYSSNKLPGQRLVSRFHSQELFTNYPNQVDFSKVDQIIFVGEFIRRVAIGKFGIPEHLTIVIPNTVNLDALDLPKTIGAQFNIGLVGIVPEQKGLDVALDLLANLRETDERFKLFIKGRLPEEYPWMVNRPKEMSFYEAQYERINSDPRLQGAVTFDEHGNDMPDWYRKIGIALSVSSFESFHFTIADGAASGAIPVSLAWPGSELVYPESWLSTSISELATRIQGVVKNAENYGRAAFEAQQFAKTAYSKQTTVGSLIGTLTESNQQDRKG